MLIKKLCKQIALTTLFVTLVLQLGSATSWFSNPAPTLNTTSPITLPPSLPLGITKAQLTQSLAQFTTDGVITPEDITAFLDSASRGAALTYQLFFATTPTQHQYKNRKEHLRAITDLVSFFYLVAMLSRDDGLMPADVTFGVIDPMGTVKNFTLAYLTRVRDHKKLNIGSETSLFGANHLAYYRPQSHGFVDAWGLNLYVNKDTPYAPLLFVNRWTNQTALATVQGPLYHLLIGTDQHVPQQLYIKPEECGLHHWGEWLGHAKGYLKVVGRNTPLINHLLDTDDDPECNKERLPRAVLANFKAGIRAQGKRIGTNEKDAIRRGIAGMYQYAQAPNWREFIVYLESHFTLPHLRRGNEIIISPETAIWSLCFATADPAISQLLNRLATLKRALVANSAPDVRRAAADWLRAYQGAREIQILKNGMIRPYLDRIASGCTTLLRLDDRGLAAFVVQKRHVLCA